MKTKIKHTSFLISLILLFFPNVSSCKKPDLYASLGDSITWGEDPWPGHHRLKIYYSKIVANKMNWKNDCPAVCGATIAKVENPNIYWIGDEINRINSSTKFISLMGGTNDYCNGVDLGDINDEDIHTFYGSLNFISLKLKELFSEAFIFYLTPLKWRHNDKENKIGLKMENYVNAVKNIGVKFKIPVFDTYSLDIVPDLIKTGDDLHPSEYGHQNIIAPYIIEQLKNNVI